MKTENIVRYSLEEIEERIRKGESRTDWNLVNAMTPEDVERLADEDDRRLGIDPDEWGKPVWVNGIEDLMALHKREEARRTQAEVPEDE